jgi:hypothetical protein
MAAPSSLGNQASRVPLVSQGSTLIRDEPFFCVFFLPLCREGMRQDKVPSFDGGCSMNARLLR